MRKNFFPLSVTEPWPRLPREVVESPSLDIFKTALDAVLCSLLWVTLLGQGVGLGDPQRALPTPNILCVCIWDPLSLSITLAAPTPKLHSHLGSSQSPGQHPELHPGAALGRRHPCWGRQGRGQRYHVNK